MRLSIKDVATYFRDYQLLRLIVIGRYGLQPKDNNYFRYKAQLQSRVNALKAIKELEPIGGRVIEVSLCHRGNLTQLATKLGFSKSGLRHRKDKALKLLQDLLNDQHFRLKHQIATPELYKGRFDSWTDGHGKR